MPAQHDLQNGVSWRKRLLISVAIGFALIPVWRLSDSLPGRLGIVASVATAVFVLSLVVDKLRERYGSR